MPSHDQVAHAWAHQTGKQRNGKRMFYDGSRIYSHGYHFLIARLLDVKGVPSVLFTTRDYSVSTSQHKAIAHGAVHHLQKFYVADPGHSPDRADWETHLDKAGEEAAKAKRARLEYSINSHLSQAQNNLDRANALNTGFDLGLPEVTLETLGVHIADRVARIEKARKDAAKARKKAEKERFERETEASNAWLAGESGAYWRGTAADGSALLRVNGDTLETSQGASVPLAHAIKAFRFVKLCRDRSEAWRRNGHTIHVGAFHVDAIEANGDFRAGCHTIRWTECARLAREIGIFGETASAEALEPTAHA